MLRGCGELAKKIEKRYREDEYHYPPEYKVKCPQCHEIMKGPLYDFESYVGLGWCLEVTYECPTEDCHTFLMMIVPKKDRGEI